MKDLLQNRAKRTLLLVAAGLIVGVGMGLTEINAQKSPNAIVVDKGTSAEPIAGVEIGGPFTLTDQNGNIVTEKSYGGQYKLVYFGFTMCPMICPTGLQKIAKTLDTLGPAGENIQPILISVDPERDTPDVLKQYVKQFHPRLVGLTGTKADIESVEKNYRVFASKVEDESLSEYTMDHSAFTYLMSPDNKLVALYRDSDTADMMAADIKSKIN